MTNKTKSPMPAKHKAPATQPKRKPSLQKTASPQADSRWQRTVRYGWDKGGAKGGR